MGCTRWVSAGQSAGAVVRLAVAATLVGVVVGCGGGAAPAATIAPVAVAPKPVENSDAQKAKEQFASLSERMVAADASKRPDPASLRRELEGIISLDDRHAAALFNLGVLDEQQGDVKAARAHYTAAMRADPEFAPAGENLSALLVDGGDRDEAKRIYDAIAKRDPKNTISRLALARMAQRGGDYSGAIDLCRKVLQRQADSIEAFRILAYSYNATNNTPMAELVIGRALKVAKDDPELELLLAQILLARGDQTGAVARLKLIVTKRPKWLKVRAQLADIALTYRDFGNAAPQYEAILQEKPGDRAAQIGLAVSYKGLGRYEQASKVYEALLAQNPKDAVSLWDFAVLTHRQFARYDDAVALYRRAKSAASSDDTFAAKIDGEIAEAETAKKDMAATKAREERELAKRTAIQATCAAVQNGQRAKPDAIGNEQERIEVAWQLWVDAQAMLQGGDVPGGEQVVRCALAVVPEGKRGNSDACAPMRVLWTQALYQLGRIDEALATIRDALKCDAENPDAQLIEQQLVELMAQQKAAGAPPDAAVPAPPAAGAAGGASGKPSRR
ncbi:MAG: tetratricopeptide repeat protein [Myxococcota bacterium]